MRHIWVHGDYMQALDRDVLLGALELQNELLGPTINFNPRQLPTTVEVEDAMATELSPPERDAFHVINGLNDKSWFFHSPLQYWSCDPKAIASDKDIIGTVNRMKTQPTSVNVTLRHSIVFSGKRFEDRRLVAADALVITLIYRHNSPVGRIWQEKARALASKMAEKWDVYPSDGSSMPSQLYEFQFRPMSHQDTFALGIAYALSFIYFAVSLSKLRAVKSKMGLVITVMAQLIVSIMSSFTICALLKIDLSRIPRFAYPIVVFSLSLENIIRLINAVIDTPSEDNTSNRIGHAFGETTHIALASVAQNLFILWGLSKIVSPGVSAFCTFAAIAIILDFFYLSTFFLSVLSVDVRRLELGDALAKASLRTNRAHVNSQPRQSWIDSMLQGKIALSTRIAGTIVMVGFVMIAQWHFFENESIFTTFTRLFSSSRMHSTSSPMPLHVDIHQARSPTSWLRLQDHETAREVIHVIKPDAKSYTARVFEPLVFVRKGADRMFSARERMFLPAVYDFARHQSTPFIVMVPVIAAAVRLLTNYLLWDDLAESPGNDANDDEPAITVRTLGRGHSLDVAMLCASSDGYIVSVGLDRLIRVWDVKAGGRSYVLRPDDGHDLTFPILAICINDDSHWLALLTADVVVFWDLPERRWGPSIPIKPCRHKPESFFFTADRTQGMQSLVHVRRDGTMTEIRPDEGEATSQAISGGSVIVSSGALVDKATTKLMASTREGQVYCMARTPTGWDCKPVDIERPLNREFMSIVPLPELGFILVVRTQSIDLVDSVSYMTYHSFKTDPIQPKTLKYYHSKRRQMQCGSVGLKFLTFAYIHAFTRDLIVHSYSPPSEGESICFREPGQPVSKTCCKWPHTKETRRVIKDPGVWEALQSGVILGVRKKVSARTNGKNAEGQAANGGGAGNANGHQNSHAYDGLRRRRHSRSHSQSSMVLQPKPNDDWEVWMLSQPGKLEIWETIQLCPNMEDDGHLFVTNLGPMVRVGRGSVAVGLSNVIKVIIVGREKFEAGNEGSALENSLRAQAGRRRNKPSTIRRPSFHH